MASPLAALVEGYQSGQELHIKKAEKIAKEQSTKFQQEFEVAQAKQKAAYEKQQQDFERQRIALEKTAQERLSKQQEEHERHDKALESAKQIDQRIRLEIEQGKLDLSDVKSVRALNFRIASEYIKGGLGDDEAYLRAQQRLYDFQQMYPHDGSAPVAPPQGAGAGNAPQEAPTGQGQAPPPNYLQNQLQSLLGQGSNFHLHHMQPPAERSQTSNEVLPMIGLKMKQIEAQSQALAALEQKRLAEAQNTRELTEATKQSKEAMTQKARAQADLERKRAQQYVEESKSRILVNSARASALLAHIQTERKEVDIRQQEENRKRTKDEIENASTYGRAAKEVSSQMRQWNATKLTLSNKMEKLNKEWADNEAVLWPGFLESQIQTGKMNPHEAESFKHRAEGLKKAIAQSQQETHSQQVNADVQYNYYADLAAKHNITVRTTPSGAPSPQRQHANQQAVERDLHQAQRQQRKTQERPGSPAPAHKKKKGKLLFKGSGYEVHELN